MESRSAGVVVVAIGIAIVLIGLLVMTGALSWFGRLPGDIRVERENLRVYIPITSMVIASAVLSGIVWLVGRIVGR